jgi:hypothetical protein
MRLERLGSTMVSQSDAQDGGFEPNRTDIVLKLMKKTDAHGDTYHMARCDAPILLDLRECTIFVFTGDNPEISIRKTRVRLNQSRRQPGRNED